MSAVNRCGLFQAVHRHVRKGTHFVGQADGCALGEVGRSQLIHLGNTQKPHGNLDLVLYDLEHADDARRPRRRQSPGLQPADGRQHHRYRHLVAEKIDAGIDA